jgi:hypothetical protein
VVGWLLIILPYIGLFVAPIVLSTPLGFRHCRLSGKRLCLASLLAVFVALALIMPSATLGFPYLRNKLTPYGFLSPNEIIIGDRPILWPKEVSYVAAIVCALAIGCFVLKSFCVSGTRAEVTFKIIARRFLFVCNSSNPV